MLPAIGSFLAALIVALVLTPPVRRLALRIGALDPVVNRSIHAEPKPYLGGLVIYAAFVVGLLFFGSPLTANTWGIILVGGLVCGIGLVDDLRRPRGIPAGLKFALQIAAVLVLVVGFNVRVDWVRNPWAVAGADPYFYLGHWAIPVTVLWIVSFINIVNLVDGLDGLAAGISGIGAVTLLLVALGQGQIEVVLLTAALAGAAIGFLRYNFNPAEIFMGDAGAMFLGFALGAVSVHGVLKSAATVGIAVPILAFGLPILDTALAITRRLMSGRPVGEADRKHLHHRLLQMGLSHRAAVLSLWAVSGWLGLSAVVLVDFRLELAFAVILVAAVGGLVAVRRIGVIRQRRAARVRQ